MSVRIFETTKHANIYSKFRPTVPEVVIDVCLQYLESYIPSDKWQIAVDVGCGSGQGTNVLAKYFQKCYGFDVSPAQISEAKESKHFDNVFYSVSPAESLPSIESNSVQLLTAFEAAHWFDLENFFKESDRILVDKGVVAFIGYLLPRPVDPNNNEHIPLIKLVEDAYFDPRLAATKNPKIVPLESHYRGMKFPNNYELTLCDNIVVSYPSTAQNLVGYIESWSLFQGFAEKDKHSAQLFIREFEENLKYILKTDNLNEQHLTLNYNYFIAIGRKMF